MRLLLHFSVLTVLCAICCAQTKPRAIVTIITKIPITSTTKKTTTRTTTRTTQKALPTITSTTKRTEGTTPATKSTPKASPTTTTTKRTEGTTPTTKSTTKTTSRPTKSPCWELQYDLALVKNSCYEPTLSSVFGDNGDGSFDAAFKECGGNDETLYYLTYFKLNEFYDQNNNFNLNNTNPDKRLLAQEEILFCIFQKLGIVDSKKTFTNDDAANSKAISVSIKKFPYWYSIWNCLHRLCNKLVYINVGWNIRIVIYIRCYIWYMYMDYIGWPILKSRAIPEGLTWQNSTVCNETLSGMYSCNKGSSFNQAFPTY
ncbi:uncharacterized protein LOC135945719 [Cloeon dipterum]|uniref:uncharacterized protein LOC135945719 n=1 Tax=Cloeon dipterum TaxID=197152 RepID=UPI00322001C2